MARSELGIRIEDAVARERYLCRSEVPTDQPSACYHLHPHLGRHARRSDRRTAPQHAVVAESSTEMVPIGLLALQSGTAIEFFVDNIFTFPTCPKAYRMAHWIPQPSSKTPMGQSRVAILCCTS